MGSNSAPGPEAAAGRGPIAWFLELSERIRIERMLSWLAGRSQCDALILAVCVLVLVFPLIAIRGYHFEEGLTVAVAKKAMLGGEWWVPELFGYRWIERPMLLSWLIAAISLPFGTVTPILARLPVALAMFVGAMMVVRVTRAHASREAGLFAALAFLFSPIIANKAVTAESDILLTVVQFGAFLIWWRGYARGGGGFLGWAAVGLLMAATAAFKGLPPAAYFALGVGAFILVVGGWRELPGYALAGAISLGILGLWYLTVVTADDLRSIMIYNRVAAAPDLGAYLSERLRFIGVLLLQFLPATALLIPAFLLRRQWRAGGEGEAAGEAPRRLVLALVLYGSVAAIVLFLWPGARSRYAMPAIMPLFVIAGFLFDRILARQRMIARIAISILIVLVVYRVVWGWVIAPVAHDRFARSRIAAHTIEQVMRGGRAPLFAELRSSDAILAYLERPVYYRESAKLKKLKAPAWVLLLPGTLKNLRAARPDLAITIHTTFPRVKGLVLISTRRR